MIERSFVYFNEIWNIQQQRETILIVKFYIFRLIEEKISMKTSVRSFFNGRFINGDRQRRYFLNDLSWLVEKLQVRWTPLLLVGSIPWPGLRKINAFNYFSPL